MPAQGQEAQIISTTMAVKKRNRQSGQSLLEFAFLVPLIVGMLTLLVEVETVISAAIVGQKYTRQHLHFLLFNHRHYPQPRFLERSDGTYHERWWIGLDDNINDTQKPPTPVAPKFKVGRKKVPGGQDDEPEPAQRQNVRLRISAFMCVPPVGAKVGQLYSENNIEETTFAGGNFRGFCNK